MSLFLLARLREWEKIIHLWYLVLYSASQNSKKVHKKKSVQLFQPFEAIIYFSFFLLLHFLVSNSLCTLCIVICVALFDEWKDFHSKIMVKSKKRKSIQFKDTHCSHYSFVTYTLSAIIMQLNHMY